MLGMEQKSLSCSFKNFLYDIISLANNPEFLEITNIHQSRNQDYFARFMQLVSQYCKKKERFIFMHRNYVFLLNIYQL